MQDEYRDSEQTVIASDFYHSNSIMPLSDEAIVAKVKANLDACEPAFRATSVQDYAVLRFPKAVTHFTPGSYRHRPQQATSIPNVFMAGDWVKGVPHGANGLSQVPPRPPPPAAAAAHPATRRPCYFNPWACNGRLPGYCWSQRGRAYGCVCVLGMLYRGGCRRGRWSGMVRGKVPCRSAHT